MSEKETKIANVLRKYLPHGTESYVQSLFEKYSVFFKIVPPRKSKLGDFKVLSKQKYQITVNGNLNQYAFLVTTIHEFAHLKTWQEYGNKVEPHGQEWKNNFIKLMHPIVLMGILPKDVEQALLNSFTNMKASSCTDIQLQRVLLNYDEIKSSEIILEKLPKNATFVLNNRLFIKGDLKRTRFVCEEKSTGKKYLIYKLTTVQLT